MSDEGIHFRIIIKYGQIRYIRITRICRVTKSNIVSVFKEDSRHLVTVNRDPEQYGCTSVEEDAATLNKLLEQWAANNAIAVESREQLCANPLVVQMMMDRIATLQQEFAHYEQVKRITLLPHPFSMEKGELTNTLKMRRPVIAKNYKDLIDKMYEE